MQAGPANWLAMSPNGNWLATGHRKTGGIEVVRLSDGARHRLNVGPYTWAVLGDSWLVCSNIEYGKQWRSHCELLNLDSGARFKKTIDGLSVAVLSDDRWVTQSDVICGPLAIVPLPGFRNTKGAVLGELPAGRAAAVRCFVKSLKHDNGQISPNLFLSNDGRFAFVSEDQMEHYETSFALMVNPQRQIPVRRVAFSVLSGSWTEDGRCFAMVVYQPYYGGSGPQLYLYSREAKVVRRWNLPRKYIGHNSLIAVNIR